MHRARPGPEEHKAWTCHPLVTSGRMKHHVHCGVTNMDHMVIYVEFTPCFCKGISNLVRRLPMAAMLHFHVKTSGWV